MEKVTLKKHCPHQMKMYYMRSIEYIRCQVNVRVYLHSRFEEGGIKRAKGGIRKLSYNVFNFLSLDLEA